MQREQTASVPHNFGKTSEFLFDRVRHERRLPKSLDRFDSLQTQFVEDNVRVNLASCTTTKGLRFRSALCLQTLHHCPSNMGNVPTLTIGIFECYQTEVVKAHKAHAICTIFPPRNRLQEAVLFTTATTPVVLGHQRFHTRSQALQLELKCSLILALNSLSGDTQPTEERFKGFHPLLYKAPTSRRGLKQRELEGENHAIEFGDFNLSTVIMIA